MTVELIALVIAGGGVPIAVGSAVVAALTYKARSRQQRAEWLERLLLRFRETNSFATVRADLSHNDGKEMKPAINKRLGRNSTALTPAEVKLLEELESYFAFFELVTHLYREGQLAAREIDSMFSWYLVNLGANRQTRDYLDRYYGHLWTLIQIAQDSIIDDAVAAVSTGAAPESAARSDIRARFGAEPKALGRFERALILERYAPRRVSIGELQMPGIFRSR